MELPQELLDHYPSVARKQVRQNLVERTPMYRTFPVTIYFSDGTSEDIAFTVKNKAYWGGAIRKRHQDRMEQQIP